MLDRSTPSIANTGGALTVRLGETHSLQFSITATGVLAVPTGTVQLSRGSALLGTGSLVNGVQLPAEGITFFTDCYLPGRTDDERRDPAVSPAFADLRGLPSALMSVGTSDHLLDDTLMLAARSVAVGGATSS